MGCSRGQLGSTLLGLWGTRQNVPRDVATEGWRGEGINAITLVAFGYRSPQETLNSSSCNLTRKLSEAREKVARNDVGAEWRGCWVTRVLSVCWELSAPAAGGSKGGGEGHPQFYDTQMILDDLFLSEEWVSSVARSDHFPSPHNFFYE